MYLRIVRIVRSDVWQSGSLYTAQAARFNYKITYALHTK